MTTCRYCVAHKSYVGILVNLRTVVIVAVCRIRDSFCGPMVLRLVGILPLFSGNIYKHSRPTTYVHPCQDTKINNILHFNVLYRFNQ